MEDDYPWDVGRTEPEAAFLRCLRAKCRPGHPQALFDAWTHYSPLVVTLTIDDPERNLVIRTLRVDFDGASLTMGNDPSHQIDLSMDESGPDYRRVSGPLSPEKAADLAFEWFEEQGRRAIDRHEWDEDDEEAVLWVLVDEGRWLAGVGTANAGRQPDRVTRIPPVRL